MGPVLRSGETDLPKKVRALGLKMALSSKHQSGDLIVLDGAPTAAHLLADFIGGEAGQGILKKYGFGPGDVRGR